MQKLWFIYAWVCLSLTVLMGNAIAVSYFLTKSHQPVQLISSVNSSAIEAPVQPQLPPVGEVKGISTIIDGEDARVQLVTNFLKRHSSPLDPDEFGKKLVAIADKYGIDFRLLPAISMQESNLCKKIPAGTFNCLGFGITKTETLGFDNYDASFDRAGRELKKNYVDEGLTTPEQIMEKYTPSSNGSWAESVNQWMAEMRYDDHDKGLALKTDANLLEFMPPKPNSASH